MFEQYIQSFINEWLDVFVNPQKRIFLGYLLSAFVIALFWLLILKNKSLLNSLKIIFNKNSWLSASAKADYGLMLINTMMMLVIAPRLLEKTVVAYFIFSGLSLYFSSQQAIFSHLPQGLIAIGFTLTLFIVDDFARYWLHRWLHKVPELWAFHQVHHSATALNPLTVFRSHPIEAVLFSIRGALVQGLVVAVFIYFFGQQVTLTQVLGANIFSFLFNALGSNLRHSPVSIGYWKSIERYFMSPAQHHIHHSYAAEHIDKNFGVVFSCWDRWFKTICYSQKDQTLEYGLNQHQTLKEQRLSTLYLLPFIKAKELVANRMHSHLR